MKNVYISATLFLAFFCLAATTQPTTQPQHEVLKDPVLLLTQDPAVLTFDGVKLGDRPNGTFETGLQHRWRNAPNVMLQNHTASGTTFDEDYDNGLSFQHNDENGVFLVSISNRLVTGLVEGVCATKFPKEFANHKAFMVAPNIHASWWEACWHVPPFLSMSTAPVATCIMLAKLQDAIVFRWPRGRSLGSSVSHLCNEQVSITFDHPCDADCPVNFEPSLGLF